MSLLQGVRLSLHTTHVGHVRRQAAYMELNLSVSVDFILQQTVFCNITLNLIFFHDFYMYALLMYENYSLLFFFQDLKLD